MSIVYDYPEGYLDEYKIRATVNLDTDSCFFDERIHPDFSINYQRFKSELLSFVKDRKPCTFYKFGDGDYFFLKRAPVGSAMPGKRAISLEYHQIEMGSFIEGVTKNDVFMVELYPRNRLRFKELYPEIEIDYPAEYAYASVASKWILRAFSGRIGLIGAREKLCLIGELMAHTRYKDYLGIDEFCDYIELPQKFACDDIELLKSSLKEQLASSSADIFLVGMGHAKSAVLCCLKDYRPAVYLDVGSGIDAIAGIIEPSRPYFGNWHNYKLKGRDDLYSSIDYLQYDYHRDQNKVFL